LSTCQLYSVICQPQEY